MKYFIVEGILTVQGEIDDNIMKKHIAYTQKAMDKGLILMSGLKEDMSGGLFIMKEESMEKVNDYLDLEPFKASGMQHYKVTEFQPHYFNESPNAWFNK